jgi:hypothetical protein
MPIKKIYNRRRLRFYFSGFFIVPQNVYMIWVTAVGGGGGGGGGAGEDSNGINGGWGGYTIISKNGQVEILLSGGEGGKGGRCASHYYLVGLHDAPGGRGGIGGDSLEILFQLLNKELIYGGSNWGDRNGKDGYIAHMIFPHVCSGACGGGGGAGWYGGNGGNGGFFESGMNIEKGYAINNNNIKIGSFGGIGDNRPPQTPPSMSYDPNTSGCLRFSNLRIGGGAGGGGGGGASPFGLGGNGGDVSNPEGEDGKGFGAGGGGGKGGGGDGYDYFCWDGAVSYWWVSYGGGGGGGGGSGAFCLAYPILVNPGDRIDVIVGAGGVGGNGGITYGSGDIPSYNEYCWVATYGSDGYSGGNGMSGYVEIIFNEE